MSFAYGCAKDAQEAFFLSRRGIWDYEREGLFVLYDNNPTRLKSIRVRAIALAHEALERNQVKVLAEADYPIGGQDAGYTWALVVDAHDTGEGQLVRLWGEAFRQSCAEHDRQSRTSPLAPNPARARGGA